jgi:cation:H+ antiporter
MLLSSFLVLLGFILLIKGADWMVNGASNLAKKFNISDLTIGLTIVAFGTSAPELVVNLTAALQNHADIVFGNVIGSNNFNLFITLGIVGIIMPINVQSSTVWKEIPISLAAVIIMFILANNFLGQTNPILSTLDGILLLLFFVFFLVYIYKQMRAQALSQGNQTELKPEATILNTKIWLLIITGMAGLIIGGKLVVENAVKIAENLGMSEKIIGLTIIAAGTSLPELVTSIVAAVKKNSDIAVGNIIGSNIFNILLVLGLSAIAKPISYNPAFNTDVLMLTAGTLFLFIAMFTGKKKKLDRWEAVILLATFIVYTGFLIAKEI